MSDALDRPFFVIGAPRSGTTYLAEVLDRHHGIVCTDETRVMTWVNRALNDLPADQRTIMRHRERWLARLETELPGIVRRFYADLGAGGGVRWGDKNPHYADPRTDPACLDTIDRLFPASQFVHIVRDGRNVLVSLQAKGWAGSLAYGVDVWIRHVTRARDFGRALGPGRFLELRYEDLAGDDLAGVGRILSFLGVEEDPGLTAFLRAGGAKEPVSGAITPAGRYGEAMWRERLGAEDLVAVEHAMADLLVEYGYETPAWRDALRAQGSPPPLEPPPGIGKRVERFLARDGQDAGEAVGMVRALDEHRRTIEADLATARKQVAELDRALARERAIRGRGPAARLRRAARRVVRGR